MTQPQTPLPKLTATVELITPEAASRLLGTMEHNRRMRRRVVERYAREMLSGRWQLNGAGSTTVVTVPEGDHVVVMPGKLE